MRPGAMLFSLSANCNSATPDCPFRLSARALGEGIRVCSATAELLRCSKAAAVGTGFICAGLARNSFTKPFMNGLPMPSENARGPNTAYEAQIQRGKSRHAAIRAVAFKWLRIGFGVGRIAVTTIQPFTSTAGQLRHPPAANSAFTGKPVDLSPGLQ